MLILSSAFAIDNSEWQAVLDRYRTSAARVDYVGIQAADALKGYMAALAGTTEPTDRADKLAFWLNAYNAITIDLVADNWPLNSIKDLDGGAIWSTRKFTVAGQSLTLDEMEKKKLVPLGDPRIHFVLNCASQGCPPLGPSAFSSARLESQLNHATRAWLPSKGVVIDRSAHTLTLSSIFDWYAHDFPDTDGSTAIPGVEGRLQGALRFVAKHMPDATASWILSGNYEVHFYPFTWTVNSNIR